MYSAKTKDERRVFFALLILSGLALLVLIVFYALNPRSVVGDSLVNTAAGTPEEFPPATFSPFYVKPITILFAAAVIFSYCLFVLIQEKLSRFPRSLRALLLLFSLLILAISSYETLFNFILWGSILVNHADPDTIVNSYPISSFKVNLVFATKSFVALVFVSFFSYSAFKTSLGSENI